jgi:hypothetical protein
MQEQNELFNKEIEKYHPAEDLTTELKNSTERSTAN